ncbi:Hypothetical predicted protein [Xyrichtys novacula]|uniref:Uncharacterized protein n=1 Tax=Xyrichtys novacula TaxID=13765 RepID=A0AAV1F399_XYRNO|nr:Hypothetical predicted protein [Xyrichtys novacula]
MISTTKDFIVVVHAHHFIEDSYLHEAQRHKLEQWQFAATTEWSRNESFHKRPSEFYHLLLCRCVSD